MRIPLPTLVAIIGVLGVIAGSFIQAVIARTNRRHERVLALEIKRTEERISAYRELVEYVMQAERVAERTIGSFGVRNFPFRYPSVVGDKIGLEKADPMSDELAARLTTFGSDYLNLFFSCWMVDYHHVDRARGYKGVISLLTLRKDGYISSEDEADLDRAGRIADRRAAMFARKIVRQVQAELAGESSFRRTGRKISGYCKDRLETRRNGLENKFMEDALDRVGAKISAAIATLKPTEQADLPHPGPGLIE
jgi:hypothetical protein